MQLYRPVKEVSSRHNNSTWTSILSSSPASMSRIGLPGGTWCLFTSSLSDKQVMIAVTLLKTYELFMKQTTTTSDKHYFVDTKRSSESPKCTRKKDAFSDMYVHCTMELRRNKRLPSTQLTRQCQHPTAENGVAASGVFVLFLVLRNLSS